MVRQTLVRWMLGGAVVFLGGLAPTPVAAAHGTLCNTSLLRMKEVKFWSGTPASPDGKWRCTGNKCEAWGWLYYPPSGDRFKLPAVVYNVGSGQAKGEGGVCAMAEYFVGQGYVFLVALRRGYEASNGDFASTGTYFSDYQEACALGLVCLVPNGSGGCATCNSGLCSAACTPAARQIKLVQYMKSESREARDALSYLKTLPSLRPPGSQPDPSKAKLVNPNGIAIMGHSFGGIVTLFANAVETRHTAAVNISADALSWGNNAVLDDSLVDAVKSAQKPIFTFQPKNEIHVEPTLEFFSAAFSENERTQAALFPPSIPSHDDGTPCTDAEIAVQAPDCTATDVHVNFTSNPVQVKRWGPAVLAFLRLYGPN